ncbi:GAF domain-containing protein [Frigoribacterium sp. VKM Ac-1396]|uniref:GAF domain-containing protein n=1 Tax=Frigoribacterium sp. VKM Ac-1396 TaxID=2783821 RepID=UPI00188A1B60|nr:GAF domain-containing protein [Frigoribacterium sp. VKM Ac-1396]MBF4599759.1 GAF domain-containing protein [Frigoribacterium sp. VKM Ac-1396]
MSLTASRPPRDAGPVRRVVRDSWDRASRRRLDPDGLPRLELPEDDLDDWRRDHPLALALPVVRRLLVDDVAGSGLLVAIGDEHGRLLWVEGDPTARRRAEDMLFVAGAGWSEARVGTSAPGTALVLDRGVQIRGDEHWNHRVQAWSCTAVPVHDPVDGHLIGVVDITGDDRAAGSMTLPLVTATVAAVEAHLALLRYAAAGRAPARPSHHPVRTATPRPADHASARAAATGRTATTLTTLGRDEAVLSVGDGRITLGARHSEIMTLLAHRAAGYTAHELADAVYGDVNAVTTLRPELVRLRHVVEALDPTLVPLSRPYRLPRPVALDLDVLVGLVDRGARRAAVRADTGPALPASTAPGVVALRAEVAATVRDAVLTDGSLETLQAFAESAAGRDDAGVLFELLRRLPPGSPRRPHLVAHLEALDDRA